MSEPPQRCQFSTGGGHTGPDGVSVHQQQVDPALVQQQVNALRADCRRAFDTSFRNNNLLWQANAELKDDIADIRANPPAPASTSRDEASPSSRESDRSPSNRGAPRRRKGGGGQKKLRPANDAFRNLLRRAMNLTETEPFPPYPLASGELPSPTDDFTSGSQSFLGANVEEEPDKPLRPDWDLLKPSLILTMRFVDPFVDKILDDRKRWKIPADKGRADVHEACVTSLDRIRYDVRAKQRKGEDRYNEEKGKSKVSSRRRERRKERTRARYAEYERRTEQALEAEWNDDDDNDDIEDSQEQLHVDRERKDDLFVLDAMSEDETDEELSDASTGTVGTVKIPCWRSEEANEILAKVDDTLARPRASRKLNRPDHRVPYEGVEPLPPTIRRWMVSKAFADQHPLLVSEVRLNRRSFADFGKDTWGSEPTMPIRPRD